MRLLEYRLDLTNHGYTVIGGDMHYEALVERKCQPIRMTNMSYSGKPTSCVEDLVNAVDKDWNAEQEETDFFLLIMQMFCVESILSGKLFLSM